MSRYTDPRTQYFDSAGDPLVKGKLFFFDSGTSTEKSTFSDISETKANPDPVILTADGRVPNIFFTGAARVKLTDKNSVQLFDVDPVGGDTAAGQFSDFDNQTIYGSRAIVIGSDGNYYSSLSSGNQSNDPTTSPAFWLQVEFINIFNTNRTFGLNETAKASDGLLYRSLVANNTGNDPASSPTKWGFPIQDVSTANIVDDAVTLAKMAQGTIGGLITYDASQDPVELVPSTVDFLLNDNGVGVPPSYKALDISKDTSPQLGGFLDPNGQFIGKDKGADLASASPLVIGTDGDFFDVTGTVGFSVMTVAANRSFILQFDDAVLITVGAGITLNNAGSDFTTAAGDIIECNSTATDTVTGRVIKKDGTAVTPGVTSVATGDGLTGGPITSTGTISVDINGATTATIAGDDEVLIADIDDSNNIKKVTAQEIADLSAGNLAQPPVVTTRTTNFSTTTTIPLDDTIPQNTEGGEVMTVTITPKDAANVLEITIDGFGSEAAANVMIGAFFRDSIANAFATQILAQPFTGNGAVGFSMRAYIVAGSTSATTLKFRAGPNIGTLFINTTSGASLFSTTATATMTVKEYLP